ncbi:hypothetical protein LMH87_010796 [Akanthomyces muscarius]|uniref:Uncharacterized protein n=1 Tax=Akanthomyces muscarius TaxID=2231603 RepID=A0A9W8QB72_AKAMU|nr:hypothetical protein LMH87_010796 [Akanthomyces muscarius]KAJ4150028.1 hypothetical protein LMH87_010796 [Akanthomyces muscarius]
MDIGCTFPACCTQRRQRTGQSNSRASRWIERPKSGGGRGQDHPLTWRMSVTCAAIYLPAPESRSIRSLRKRNTDSKSTMTVGPGRLAEPPGLTQMSLSDDNSTQDNGTLRLPLARSIGLV